MSPDVDSSGKITSNPIFVGQHGQIRQLAHDMRSSLSIISMCAQLLDDARANKQEFEELCAMMQSKGVDPLNQLIEQMVEMAQNGDATKS